MATTTMRGLSNQAAATAAGVAFAMSALTLLGAWIFEYWVGLQPCPLCLEQRLPYHMVIPLSGLMAIAALVGAPPKLLKVGFLVIILAMLIGAGLALYHAGVEWHWWAGPADCSGPISDIRGGGALVQQLQSVNVIRCDEAPWRLFGISLAGFNVLISLVIAAVAWIGLRSPMTP